MVTACNMQPRFWLYMYTKGTDLSMGVSCDGSSFMVDAFTDIINLSNQMNAFPMYNLNFEYYVKRPIAGMLCIASQHDRWTPWVSHLN